jgi:uncharacterized protein (TIGR02117 family)
MYIRLFLSLLSLFSIITYSKTNANEKHAVCIIQERWHTGIVLKTSDVPSTIFQEIENYTSHTYIELSWGDEKYYQLPSPGISIGAKALFWPTQAVIRISAFSRDINQYYADATILEIPMNKEEFFQLCRFLAESFERSKEGKIQPSTFYRNSNTFFLAKRKYSLLRTCNTWVVLGIKESGFDVTSFLAITANQLFRRLDKIDGSEYLRKTKISIIPN